jgi:hypothetical protein
VADIWLQRRTIERMYEDRYEQLEADLAELGFRVVEDQADEYRSIPMEEAGRLAIAVAMYLRDHVTAAVLAAVIAAVTKRLRLPRRKGAYPRQCTIFGPDGEVLAVVDLDDEREGSSS